MDNNDIEQTIKDLQYIKLAIGPKLQQLLDDMNSFQSQLDTNNVDLKNRK